MRVVQPKGLLLEPGLFQSHSPPVAVVFARSLGRLRLKSPFGSPVSVAGSAGAQPSSLEERGSVRG